MTSEYIITLPDFFPDRPYFFRTIFAPSAGAAKYAFWLNFSDEYPMPFGEFLKIARCRKVKETNVFL